MSGVKYQSWDNPRCEILKSLARARPMSRKLCLTCKGGRLLCGASSCPLLSRIQLRSPLEEKLSQDMFGPSPSVFVGWKGYPNVFAGPMTSLSPENAGLLDDPGSWYGLDFNDIIRLRSQLVRSKGVVNVKSRNRFVEDNRDIALSVRPTEVELHFKKKPSFGMSFSPVSQPMGPSGELDAFRVTENPKIPRRVEYVLSDEINSVEQAVSLYDSNFDVYYLTRVLSSGAMGLSENKRLVPTRWSITAVDDMIGKALMERVREFPFINEFRVYSNTYLDNHFEILLMPGAWEFEQFEAWAPQTLWTLSFDEPVIAQDSEGYGGRSDYAFNEGGGYYAGRLGVAEALYEMRRQARAVIFREIHEGYVMPVGVWEVRENVRKAMHNPCMKFATMKEALTHVKSRLRIPLGRYVQRSEILRQRRISEYV
ncbi:MAG: Nre family DNA repair protein [Candidatus Altiarchaeota archaeon]|nr:Nre family DNA repair protein [Candidatus Altiarchaeota archaeon]